MLRVIASQAMRPLRATAVRAFASETFLATNEVAERVMHVVKNFDKVDPAKVTDAVSFKALALDSLDAVEVVMAIEEEFALQIPDDEADKILTVKDAIEYIAMHPQAK